MFIRFANQYLNTENICRIVLLESDNKKDTEIHISPIHGNDFSIMCQNQPINEIKKILNGIL